ncbi:SGT1 protein-domain-containing protein [Cercophora newfieldiana]|uniref:SGT1 protein-domain-containing protein n=1 Tax=Cercophora newfieldiana TaxID=92897 RepID=A0AA39Y9Z9_9PEZI|nr:SGT1 protein-domain-containing protein [Cercophora newfieldiana]
METENEPRPGDLAFDGFRMRLPEDCVEYMLFVVGDKSLTKLEAVRKAAIEKAESLTKNYIWQREGFKLETKIQNGLSYLHGITNYGDNVEDEWLIVYLLRELSRSFPQLWVRVCDSDGEFLLIEAAKALPSWLSPENDSNRVWIHDGKLHIIPLQTAAGGHGSKSLSLREALTVITSGPDSLSHSTSIEAEAFYRLEKYPGQIADSIHHSLVTIPRKLAYIIHARPKAIALATEAFYLRDPISLRPLLSGSGPLLFPPTDLVTVSTRFTRVLYAQLKSQRFEPPPVWSSILQEGEAEVTPGDEEAAKKLSRLELGMKVTTGFEILAKNGHESNNRVAREVALLVEDLEEDGDCALPSDAEIRTWEEVGCEDDDSWMDIDFRDFEQELDGGRGTGAKASAGAGFGDAGTQADLQKIVSRFEAFLNDESAGIDGAELDEMDEDNDDESGNDESSEDEDKDVSLDEEQFARMMREMLGLPSGDGHQDRGKRTADGGPTSRPIDDDEEHDEDEEIRKLMAQMESELNGLGALSLDQSSSKLPAVQAKGSISKHVEEEEDGLVGGEVDIDYNLAKNLLESFKSQAGMAGPAGNLLNLMGMPLPRDEGDSDEDT